MISARFDTEALTRVRFAISPMLESTASVSTLDDPARADVHLPWVEDARRRTTGLDLSVLRALKRSNVYNPDFINPPPSGPLAEFEDELAVMVSTPERQIRAEVRRAYEDAVLPDVLYPFMQDPCRRDRRAGRADADLLGALARRPLAADPLAAGGRHPLPLAPARRRGNPPAVRRPRPLRAVGGRRAPDRPAARIVHLELNLDERGLLLLPSAFAWPKVMVVTAAPWQPTLIYPARGVGMLWSPEHTAPPEALARLLGRSRAALLLALDSPRSTTELAGVLGVSHGGVSQHLSILHDAGLVSRRRVQRFVLYLRSPDGDALVDSSSGQC